MGKIAGKTAAGGGSSAKKQSASSCEPDRKHLKKFEKDSRNQRRRWVNLSGDSSQASSSQPLTSSSQTPGKLSGDSHSQRKSSSASCASGADSTAGKFAKLDVTVAEGQEGQSCSSSQQMPSIGLTPTSPEAGNRQLKVEQGGEPAPTEAKRLSKVAAASSQQKSAGSKGATSSKGRGKSKRYNRSGSGKEGAGKPKGRRDQASQPSQKRLCRSEEKLSQQVAAEPGGEVEAEDAAKSSMDEAARTEKKQKAIDKYKQEKPYCCWCQFVPERLPGQSCAGVPGTPDPKLKMSKRSWEKTFHTWQQQVERYVDVQTVKRTWNYQWLRQQRESGHEIGIAPGTPNIEDLMDNTQVRQWKALFGEWKDKLDRKFLVQTTQREAFARLGSPPNPRIHHLLPEWPPRERGPDP